MASNRRVVDAQAARRRLPRYSATRDAAIRDLPEGLIDPWLKAISFWDGDQPLAAINAYATHPDELLRRRRDFERLRRPGPRARGSRTDPGVDADLCLRLQRRRDRRQIQRRLAGKSPAIGRADATRP